MARTAREEGLRLLDEQVDEIGERFPNMKPDELFTVWFLKAYLTSENDTAGEALTARQAEKGIDAIYLDVKAKVGFVVQTKYRRKRFGKPEGRSDVMAFAGLGPILNDPD